MEIFTIFLILLALFMSISLTELVRFILAQLTMKSDEPYDAFNKKELISDEIILQIELLKNHNSKLQKEVIQLHRSISSANKYNIPSLNTHTKYDSNKEQEFCNQEINSSYAF